MLLPHTHDSTQQLLKRKKKITWQFSGLVLFLFSSIENIECKILIYYIKYYMLGFIQKQYPENFASLNLRILELFTRNV